MHRLAFNGRRRGGEQGFTLLEILVSIALLATTATAALAGLSVATLALQQVRRDATVQAVARTQMEFVNNHAYLPPGNTYPNAPDLAANYVGYVVNTQALLVPSTKDNADAPVGISSLASGTADSGTTTTMVDAARTEADVDYWKGQVIAFTSGTVLGQVRLITAFDPTTDTITFSPATTVAAGTPTYEIWPGNVEKIVVTVSHKGEQKLILESIRDIR